MNRIFVGGISPEGETLLTSYLNVFMPDAVIEPLKAVGIKGRMKNHAKRQDVALVIIDESLYQACVGVADDVLSLPKVHKYINDDGLSQFLISKFGRLDGATVGVATPIEDVQPVSVPLEVTHSVRDDEFENMTFSESVDEDSTSSEDIIRDLEDKLAKSEMMVRNLTLQLKDNKSDAEDDISAFFSRIRELEESLASKEAELQAADGDSYKSQEKIAKAEKVIAEVDDLKKQLKDANEDKSELSFQRDKFAKEVETLQAKVDELTTQITDFESIKSELAEKSSEIITLTAQLAEKELELTARSAEFSGKDSEFGVLHEQFLEQGKKNVELTTEIANIKAQLADAELKVSNLTIDLESKSEELARALAEIESLKSQLATKVEELEAKERDINSSLEMSSDAESKLTELTGRIEELTAELETSKAQYEAQTAELEAEKAKVQQYIEDIESFKADIEKLEHKDAEIDMLNANIQEQKALINSLNNNIEDLKAEIVVKSDELSKAKESEVLAQESVAIKENALYDMIQEKKALEDKVVEAEEARLRSETDLVTCRAELDKLKADVDAKQITISEQLATISKLENQITSLQSNLETAKANEDSVTRLESELLEERRKSARLSSEIDVLKKNEDSGKVTELRIEVAKLKSELEQARVGTVSAEEFKKVQNEMIEYRDRCTSLELDGVDKDEELNELTNGIFGKLANIAMPKTAYDVTIDKPKDVGERFYCVAGGSLESSTAVYQLLRRTCSADSKTRYLIIDLVTDTAIDREFGITTIKSPVQWLIGSEPFRNFIAETKFRNVRVLSTALDYLNYLALLQVDWQSRLDELKGFADVVIINIGCLNNMVSKVLFNTFSTVMKTHVITKATPVNLRTVILNMTGFGTVDSNVTIDCVNFDDKASKAMYQRLVQKYKAQIVKDTDVLRL